MNIEMLDRFDPTIECLCLLSQHYSDLPDRPSNMEAGFSHFCEKFDIPFSVILPAVEPLAQAESHILQHLGPLSSQERLLFTCPDGFYANLAWGFYFLEQKGIDLQRLEGAPLIQELRHLLCIALRCPVEATADVQDGPSLANFLEDYPCAVSTKWACSVAWRKPLEYQAHYRKVLRDATALFQEVEPTLTPLLKQNLSDIQEFLRSDPEDHWVRFFSPDFPKGGQITLQPLAMSPGELSTTWDHTDPGNGGAPVSTDALVLVGIYYPLMKRLVEQYQNSSELLANAAKAMGDIRRVEILKALKDRPMCNQELSDLLNLSPATISHHMNCLLQAKLVTIGKRGSRIDYSLNPQTVRAFQDSVQAAFF